VPSYGTLAAYVFFTATGEQFDPAVVKRKRRASSADRTLILEKTPE
jgi:hypothetical protein